MALHKLYQQIVPFIVFIFTFFLLFKLIQPMISILLSSVLLAYVSFPMYQKINKRIRHESFSIILSLAIVVVIVLIPLSFLTFELMQEGYYFYDSLSNKIVKGALFGYGCTSADSKLCSLVNKAERFSVERLSTFGFDKHVKRFLRDLEEEVTLFVLSIPIIIAEIFLTLVISYFILKKWKDILKETVNLLPIRTKTVKQLVREFKNITNTVIYAQLFVALVQGIIGTIGFYILGVPFPIILGMVMALCALIPTVGTGLIWVPASLFLMLSGYLSNDYWILAKGIILCLYGLLVISTIDNLLLGKIVYAKTKVNQIVVIVGVIGGVSIFGVVGIFIGPILLPLLITYFKTFKERFV